MLRPGGKETTDFLINNLPITGKTVIEFAPGLGITAKEILSKRPKKYIGIDQDPDAVANVRAILPPGDHEVIEAKATESGLEDGIADVIIGEAMLTMQTDKHKIEIMKEAARLLKQHGLYAIHELSLVPDSEPEEVKNDIRRSLAQAIKVNARTITVAEWSDLANEAGFEVINVYQAEMALLSFKRNIKDEGPKGVLTMVKNMIKEPELRKKVLKMRETFSKNKEHLGAVGMILRKK